MKKNIFRKALLGTACLLLCALPVLAEEPQYHEATQADQELFEEILAANTMENHLKEHGTFQENCRIYDSKGKVSARYLFWGSADGVVYGALTLTLMDNEKLTLAGESEDLFYMVTETTDLHDIQTYMASAASLATDLDYEIKDGMALRFYSAFNKETYEIEADDVALVLEDGTEKLLEKVRTVYDLTYDISTSPFADYYSKNNQERQIQIVLLANGTEQAQSFGYTIPRGVFFDVYYEGDFPEVYTDPNCTVPYDFKDSDTADQLILYLPAK